MEDETKSLVRLGAALGAVEEVLLDVVQDGEPGAAGRIGGGVLAVRASDALDDRTCGMFESALGMHGEQRRRSIPVAARIASTMETAAMSCLKAIVN